MPKITIRSNVVDPVARKAVTQAITDQFAATGVAENHVSTLFIPTDGADLYAGTRTFEEVSGDAGFALVEVMMSASRPDEFRRAMAANITSAFDGYAARTRVAIDFVAREGGDVFIGDRVMANARPATPLKAVPAEGADHGEVTEDVVRQALLDLVWAPEVLEAPADTPLDALHPDRGHHQWDSLDGVEAVEGVLELLGLPLDQVDPGSAVFEEAVSGSPSLGDLLSYLRALLAA